MNYSIACPNCGKDLVPHVGDPQSAPWQCFFQTGGCGRGWFVSELSLEARNSWRPQLHDHGETQHMIWLDVLRLGEVKQAHSRGTSALPEHLPLLPDALIDVLHTRGLSPDFRQQVLAESLNRPGQGKP